MIGGAASDVERPDVTAPDDESSRNTGAEEVFEAPALLRIIWADPQHMAEHLAVWSLTRFGPRARSAVAKLHSREPPLDRDELEQLVVERQTRVATTEGAFVGGPFILLIPVAFCAALLAQAQMVYELAAVSGRNPVDRLRAAELLVLLGAYPSTDEAASALTALPRDAGSRKGARLPAGTRLESVKRMAYLLEILGPPDPTRSRLRATVGWLGIGVLVLVGLVLPLVWVPYMSYSTRRSTLRMAARARNFYAATMPGDVGVAVQREQRVATGGTVAFARMVLLIVFPLVIALVGLLTGFSFAGGRGLTAALVLLALSALATLCWLGYRRRLRRRRSRADAQVMPGSQSR